MQRARWCRVGDRDPDCVDEHAQPGRPVAEERVGAGERAFRGHPGGTHARDDPEGDQAELRACPDEPARAGDHLALGQLEEGGRQRDAGNEDDERGDHRPEAGIGDVVLHGERGQRGDGEGGEEGHQHLERAPPAREQPQHADDCAEHGRRGDVAGSRTQDQRDPDRQRRVAQHARERPEAAARRPDLLEPGDAGARLDGTSLRLLGEAMDGRNLVESRSRREPLRRLDRRGLAASERQEERRRKDAEARILEPVSAGDQGEALLDGVDRLTDRAERRAEIGEEQQELVAGRRSQRTRMFRHLGRRGVGIDRRCAADPLPDHVEHHGQQGDHDDRGERLGSVAERVDCEEGEDDGRRRDRREHDHGVRARIRTPPVARRRRRGGRSRASTRSRPTRSRRG